MIGEDDKPFFSVLDDTLTCGKLNIFWGKTVKTESTIIFEYSVLPYKTQLAKKKQELMNLLRYLLQILCG